MRASRTSLPIAAPSFGMPKPLIFTDAFKRTELHGKNCIPHEDTPAD